MGHKHWHAHDHGHGHGHGHGYEALEGSAAGMRAVRISLAALGVTACAQLAVVALSGSVALLGDALHNAADALTAVPLGVAFMLGRRQPNRRYTYGYGRAEDLAGIVVVLAIGLSSAVAVVTAAQRLVHPRPVTHLAAVAVAAALGFAGNELVARYRIRTGRRIGSASLVADGLHARTDGFTSLAVLLGAGGVALGWRWADPVLGLLITVAVLGAGWQAGRQVRLRWVGHRLRAECEIQVDPASTAVAAHHVAVAAEHALMHAMPRLVAAAVHADPCPAEGADHHALLAGHVS